MTIFKTSLAAGSRYSVAMCTVLACLNVAYADFGKDAIVDNGGSRFPPRQRQRPLGKGRSVAPLPIRVSPRRWLRNCLRCKQTNC